MAVAGEFFLVCMCVCACVSVVTNTDKHGHTSIAPLQGYTIGTSRYLQKSFQKRQKRLVCQLQIGAFLSKLKFTFKKNWCILETQNPSNVHSWVYSGDSQHHQNVRALVYSKDSQAKEAIGDDGGRKYANC